MDRIAVSISHEADYAVAIAFGVRTAGGRYVFPPDIEARLDDRERRLLARMERLRALHEEAGRLAERRDADRRRSDREPTVADAAGRVRAGATSPRRRRPRPPCPARSTLDDAAAAALLPERPKRGHKGAFGKLLVIAGSLDYAGAALLVCRAAGRAGAGLVTLAVPESLQPLFAAKVVEATTMALPEDDVEEVDPEPSLARILDHDHDAIVVGPGLRPGLATAELVRRCSRSPADERPPPIVLDAEALRSLATLERWWEGDRRPAVLTPHVGRVRAAPRGQRPRARRATATSSTTTPPGLRRQRDAAASGARSSS